MTNDEYERLPELLKVREVADLLAVKSDTVLKMIKCGRILEDETFMPTSTSHKLIYKSAVLRLLRIKEVPKGVPTQIVYSVSKRTADNLMEYHDEDVANGIAKIYAPWRVDRAIDGNDRYGQGLSIITGDI